MPRVIVPIEDPAALVRWREQLLIEAEDAMFRVIRDDAPTAEERAFWDAVILGRERRAAGSDPGSAT